MKDFLLIFVILGCIPSQNTATWIKWVKYVTTDAVPTPPVTTQKSSLPTQCGRTYTPLSRVVGGQNAISGAWPFQVAIFIQNRFHCGGVLIHPEWVLSAAHCTSRFDTRNFVVGLGIIDLSQRRSTEQYIRVTSSVRHNYYNLPTLFNNDLVLFKLVKPALLTKYVQPICLPSQDNDVADGVKAYVTGWGDTRYSSPTPFILQQVSLSTLTWKQCSQKNSKIAPITKHMLCAANIKPNLTLHSACHGDSGGPLHIQRSDGNWELHGIVSWGSATCNTTDAFTVFTRVSKFRHWIDYIINFYSKNIFSL